MFVHNCLRLETRLEYCPLCGKCECRPALSALGSRAGLVDSSSPQRDQVGQTSAYGTKKPLHLKPIHIGLGSMAPGTASWTPSLNSVCMIHCCP